MTQNTLPNTSLRFVENEPLHPNDPASLARNFALLTACCGRPDSIYPSSSDTSLSQNGETSKDGNLFGKNNPAPDCGNGAVNCVNGTPETTNATPEITNQYPLQEPIEATLKEEVQNEPSTFFKEEKGEGKGLCNEVGSPCEQGTPSQVNSPDNQLPNQEDPRSNPRVAAVWERKYHLSRCIAEKTTVTCAVLLPYLAEKTRRSKISRDGKKFYYNSIAKLQLSFPWLSDSAISKAIHQLEKQGMLIIARYNRHGYDRTSWYSVPMEWQDKAEEKPLFFKVRHAFVYGLPEAVLLENLRYNCRKNTTEENADYWHPMFPTELATCLPFSASCITGALEHLVESGVLEKRKNLTHRTSEYRFCNEWKLSLQIVDGPITADNPTLPKVDMLEPAPGTPSFQEVLDEANEITRLWNDRIERCRPVMAAGSAYLGTLSKGDMRTLLRIRDPQQTYLRILMGNPQIQEEELRPLLLASLVIGFVRGGRIPEVNIPPCFPYIRRTSQPFMVILWTEYENMKEEAAHARFERLKLEHRSPDADHEGEVDQAPTRKAGILRNGIHAQTRIGKVDCDNHQIIPIKLRWTGRAFSAAREFFERNPAWTPADIIHLSLACEKLSDSDEVDDKEHDPMFHARRGNDLTFLIRNLASVVSELGVASRFPVIRGPGESDEEDSLQPASGPLDDREY